jgi:hypothetical protein
MFDVVASFSLTLRVWTPPVVAVAFDLFDFNHNGSLSLAELVGVPFCRRASGQRSNLQLLLFFRPF